MNDKDNYRVGGFTPGHLKVSEPSKYRRLYESALRASAALDEHRKVLAEVGPDPITGRHHSQACWAGGLRWGGADITGAECWCGLQNKPEPPPEMREELRSLLDAQSLATLSRIPRSPLEYAMEQLNGEQLAQRIEAFLGKWGVILPGEGSKRESKP